jgi:hypothetical protein
VGTKSLIEDGISPYSDETALQIQEMVYGRPAVAGEHELRVAYPLYSIIIFLPFAFVDDFNIARAAWMTLLEISLVLMSLLCLRIMRWRPGLVVLAVFFLFSITWYHAVRPLINGNAVILVALMLTGGDPAIRARHEELAGVLLAFSTIKPQVVILITVYYPDLGDCQAAMEDCWMVFRHSCDPISLCCTARSGLDPAKYSGSAAVSRLQPSWHTWCGIC